MNRSKSFCYKTKTLDLKKFASPRSFALELSYFIVTADFVFL